MKTIYKYKIDSGVEIDEPIEKILDIQIQNGFIVLWAIVSDRQPKSKILFKIFGTGWEVDDFPGIYLKTVQDYEGYVWHIFAETDNPQILNQGAVLV